MCGLEYLVPTFCYQLFNLLESTIIYHLLLLEICSYKRMEHRLILLFQLEVGWMYKINQQWIERNGPIRWLPRFPDLLMPLHFVFWGHVKASVYRIQGAAQTVNVGMLYRVQVNILRRAQTCLLVNGQHFEQLF